MDTIEQPGAVDPALYKLYDSNRLQDLRCKTRMIRKRSRVARTGADPVGFRTH